jgi:hypothetical protein
MYQVMDSEAYFGENNLCSNVHFILIRLHSFHYTIFRHPTGQQEQWAADAWKRLPQWHNKPKTHIYVNILELG